jgi:hypothetical protein
MISVKGEKKSSKTRYDYLTVVSPEKGGDFPQFFLEQCDHITSHDY